MIPRYYQDDSVEKLFNFVIHYEGHPLVVMPTGSGKTVVLCEFINRYITESPEGEILVLSHTKQILKQDYSALCDCFGDRAVGLYSAGLKSKEVKKVTVAGIQSVYKKAMLFENVGIVIIDEAHLITIEDSGMYRKLFDAMEQQFGEVTYVGLTATHFRAGHGYIHKGEGALFTDVVADYTEFKAFNKMVSDGHLARLISKRTKLELDPEGVRSLGGDYRIKDLSMKFDRQSITNKAVEETILFGKKYKKWLIFAINIEHATNVDDAFRTRGVNSCVVHSKLLPEECEKRIEDFKAGEYQSIVNVDMLTVGFDDPEIDLIAVLRHTKSPVLHVQLLGRGLRPAPGKDHCLVLDFAGNCSRLGPVNDVRIPRKEKGEGEGEAPVRTCPNCDAHSHASAKECEICGFVFPVIEKIQPTASMSAVMRESLTQWVEVKEVAYSVHAKAGKPSSMRVSYMAGVFSRFSEWITYDHKGWAKRRADNWVKHRLPVGAAMPVNLAHLLKMSGQLKVPAKILVDNSGKFAAIKDSKF